MTLFIVRFESNGTCSNVLSYTIGAFSSEEKAEKAITKRIDDEKFYNGHIKLAEHNRNNYSITECELDEEI